MFSLKQPRAAMQYIKNGILYKTPKQKITKLTFLGLLLFGLILTVVNVVNYQLNTQSRADVGGDYDVIVAGGGTGGTAAAIQAARQGAKVLLVEETDWLGGQMTAAGVSMMDEGTLFLSTGTEAIERKSGIYEEFIKRITDAFGDARLHKCLYYKEAVCFEPLPARHVLESMVSDAGVQVVLNTKVNQVIRSGTKVTGVILSDGKIYNSKVLIDATEYGDLLPLARVAYRVGNTTSENENPNAVIQDITYTAIIRKCTPGVDCLKVPDNPPGSDYANAKAKFEQYVSNSGSTDWNNRPLPRDWALHNAYRGIPDSPRLNDVRVDSYDTARDSIYKTGVNLANDYPYTQANTVKYLEDMNYRKQINCEAKLHTLQFIYYMQHDQGQPWSLTDDQEYQNSTYTNNNLCSNIPAEYKELEKRMPVIPYVRESRRIIGKTTLTAPQANQEKAITAEINPDYTLRYDYNGIKSIIKSSTIAIGGYNFDIHGCKTNDCLESGLESASDVSDAHGAFQVPMETLIPETVDGFLAAEKNISVSRLVNGATRLQPITMLTGQAAGSLAAIAAKTKDGVARFVNPLDVQQALIAGSDSNLEFPAHLSLFRFADAKISYPPDNYAHAAQIASLYKIMTGFDNSTFGTNDPLTRGQTAIVIARLFDLQPNSTEQEAVTTLQTNNIARGSSDYASFNPAGSATKGAVALFLARAFAKYNLNADPGDDAESARQMLAAKNISLNCDNSSCLGNGITRGEMADASVSTMHKSPAAPFQAPTQPAAPERTYQGYTQPTITPTPTTTSGQILPPVPGNGLLGQYFTNKSLSGTPLSRIDATVNFSWGTGSPMSGVGVDNFSVRWEGQVVTKYTQPYTFYVVSDDGVRLWVNNQLIIDKWVDQAPTESKGSLGLSADKPYAIKLEYYENGGGATAKLYWSSYNQPKQIIPQSQLIPANFALPTATPTLAPTSILIPTATPTLRPTATPTLIPTATPTPRPTATPTPTPIPSNPNTNPIGYFDGANSSNAWGWTCDGDNYAQSIDVHMYTDGYYSRAVSANQYRADLVTALVCGGTGNHGYTFTYPDTLYDGNQHTVKIYGINIGGGTTNPELPSAKIVSFPAQQPSCTQADPQVTITNSTSGGFTITARGVKRATSMTFPTWSGYNGQDDLIWYPGTKVATDRINGDTWQATINLANHNNVGPSGQGPIYVHTYMYNAGYNGVFCDDASFTLQGPAPVINPIGYQDIPSPTCQAYRGWACDGSDYSQPLTVHLYAYAPAGSAGAVFLGATTANVSRPDAASLCGGYSNHGYTFNLPNLPNGTPIYAYAINIGGGNTNPLLGNSPWNVSCTVPTPTPISCNRCSNVQGCTRAVFIGTDATCVNPVAGSVTYTTDCSCPGSGGAACAACGR